MISSIWCYHIAEASSTAQTYTAAAAAVGGGWPAALLL